MTTTITATPIITYGLPQTTKLSTLDTKNGLFKMTTVSGIEKNDVSTPPVSVRLFYLLAAFLTLSVPLTANTVHVRMIAVIDSSPQRSWSVPAEFPSAHPDIAILHPSPKENTLMWRVMPTLPKITFSAAFAVSIGKPWVGDGTTKILVFDSLILPRCDGSWLADGEKGSINEGPSYAALVSQLHQAEIFAHEKSLPLLPKNFSNTSLSQPSTYTFSWAGFIILNGAAEAAEEKSSQDFGGNFALTLSDLRAEFGRYTAIVWARLPPAPAIWNEARQRRWNRVRDMQVELAEVHPLTQCIETKDLPVIPDSAELTPEAWITLAQRAGQAVQKIVIPHESCCPQSERGSKENE